jgi:hypothetical protein
LLPNPTKKKKATSAIGCRAAISRNSLSATIRRGEGFGSRCAVRSSRIYLLSGGRLGCGDWAAGEKWRCAACRGNEMSNDVQRATQGPKGRASTKGRSASRRPSKIAPAAPSGARWGEP